ncbi:DUF3578 domain-containing protein [Neisseriaceae bacterium ESL0693]|nr:DUF3578 domain-containing protein [Neisseriaceae bacterium ESL0693]
MLAKLLNFFISNYSIEKLTPLKSSYFANYIRHNLVSEIRTLIDDWPFELIVKASVGQGNWAMVPWLAFFDPIETESATHGIYVVYLVNALEKTVTLSLNQGTIAVYEEYGTVRGTKVLKRRAADIANRIHNDYTKYFSTEPINLGFKTALTKGYEAGHALGKTYFVNHLSEEELVKDLFTILKAYSSILENGGLTPVDLVYTELEHNSILETRRYMFSRRIERSPKVRHQVLTHRPAICQACGLDPKRDYGYVGALDSVPLDVHHMTPFKLLREGESRRYSIQDDFLILCPTCHRMIHKQNDVADLVLLKAGLKFKIVPD